jgi:RHS repeat-associated protein
MKRLLVQHIYAINQQDSLPLPVQDHYYNEESGLHYKRHRQYDAKTAQYLSPAPLGLDGGVQPLRYVDNPLSWIDPLGLIILYRGMNIDERSQPMKDGAWKAQWRGSGLLSLTRMP